MVSVSVASGSEVSVDAAQVSRPVVVPNGLFGVLEQSSLVLQSAVVVATWFSSGKLS